jgi:hypothetical protein
MRTIFSTCKKGGKLDIRLVIQQFQNDDDIMNIFINIILKKKLNVCSPLGVIKEILIKSSV